MKCENCPGRPGECCRWLSLVLPNQLDEDMRRYNELHGVRVVNNHVLLIPVKCRWLTHAGTCLRYDDRPQVCRDYICTNDAYLFSRPQE